MGDHGVRVPAAELVQDVQLVPGDQPQQLLPGGVEGERRRVQGPHPPAQPLGDRPVQGALVVPVQVRQPGVVQSDALGAAGRARGVDDVREVAGTGRAGSGQVHGRAEAGRERGLVQQQPCHARQFGHRRGDVRGRQYAHRCRVPEHELQPVRRMVQVQRKVGAARTQDGEGGHHRVGRAGQRERHHGVRADALGGQCPCQQLDPVVQVGEAEPVRAADQGRRLGGVGRPLGEQVHHGLHRHRAGGGVPLRELFAFGGVEQVVPGDGERGIGDRLCEQAQEAVRQPFGRGAVEEVGGEEHLQVDVVGVCRVGEREVEVELGGAGVDPVHAGVPAEQAAHVLGDRAVRDHRLEEGVPGQAATRVDGLDDRVEGQVGVVQCGEVGGPDPLEQVGEGGVAAQVGAQDQGVDEEADEVVQRGVGASGDRGAEGDVVTGAEPVQQGGDRRVHHHEHTGAALPRQSADAGGEFGGKRAVHHAARRAGLGRTRPVGGQRQLLGQTRQHRTPVVRLPGGRRVVGAVEQGALPEREVRVLDGEFRELGCGPRGPRRVGRLQVAQEGAHGPLVARDVVQQHHQRLPPGRRVTEQRDPDGRLGRQVEEVPEGPLTLLVEAGLGRLHDPQPHARLLGGEDPLVRLPARLREHGAQRFVPGHDVTQRRVQGARVQGLGEAGRERDVVGGTRALHLVQEPQPPLGVRQGQPLRAGGGRQRRERGAVPSGQPLGQRRGRTRLEHVTDAALGAQRAPHPGDHPGGEQRVPAEGEEVVVRSHRRQAEHIREDPGQDLLPGPARRPCPGRGQPGQVGGGQRAPVDLAVGGQREGVQDHHGRGHHVLRQPGGRQLPQGDRVRDPALARRDDVGGEMLGAGHVLADHGHRTAHGLRRAQHALDLAEFDAEAAQLDLVVGPADVLDPPVRAAPHQVAGAVHAGAGRAVGVGDEPLGGQGVAAQIAARELGAGQVQLPEPPVRGVPQGAVEDMGAGVPERGADVGCARVAGGQGGGGGPDGRLGRAVDVGDLPGGPGQPLGQVRGDRLAADQHGRADQGRRGPLGEQRLPQ